MNNTLPSIYDFMINTYHDNEVLSKFTQEEIEEEIKNVILQSSASNINIIAQDVIQTLEYKHRFNELSSEYDLLDKDIFLSSVTIRELQSDKLLSIYDEDFANLKTKYKEKSQNLKQENKRLAAQNNQLQEQLPVPLSQKELLHLTYPNLNKILFPEEYKSRDANFLCDMNHINYNAALFTIEHYPLFFYMKNPVNYPSELDNKLYPYGLPEFREVDPSTNLPVNFNPSAEVYMIGVSLHSFKLKPDRLSCVRVRNDNNSCYNPTDWIDESLPRCNDNQIYFSQPIWEAFQDRYDYKINFIFHFLVFKAKPILPEVFKQYWSSQSDIDMYNNCSYYHLCKISNPNLTPSLDIQYPVMKLFYISYLMNHYLNITEKVIKNIPQSPITTITTLKPGDLIYVNRCNFGIIIGKKEVFLDNNLTIIESDNKFYFSGSEDDFIIPELLLFSESILDDTLLSIKHSINKQYNLYIEDKIRKQNV